MAVQPELLDRLAKQTDLFQRVFSQMTPAECLRALRWAGLISGPIEVRNYLTADSTLTFLHWNDGRGSFFQTTPTYRYTGGVFTQNRTASEVREILRELFERSPGSFLAANVDDARAEELLRLPSSLPGGEAAKTLVVCWDKSQLDRRFERYRT